MSPLTKKNRIVWLSSRKNLLYFSISDLTITPNKQKDICTGYVKSCFAFLHYNEWGKSSNEHNK